MSFNLICFGGLPRSCSTVLINILAQNPLLKASPTSTLSTIPFGIVNAVKALPFIDKSQEGKEYKVAREATFSFLSDTVTTDTYIDKGREWILQYQKTKSIFPDAKFIVLVRDIRGCLSSCKELEEGSALFNNLVVPYIKPLTELFVGGVPKDVLLIKAEDFTDNPNNTIMDIYSFLGIKPFKHTLTNIETLIDDPTGTITNQPKLHAVSANVIPCDKDYNAVLGSSVSDFIVDRFIEFYKVFYPEVILDK